MKTVSVVEDNCSSCGNNVVLLAFRFIYDHKLLIAIFGRASEDVKNDSLETAAGVEGIVVKTEKFSRREASSEAEQEESLTRKRRVDRLNQQIAQEYRKLMAELEGVLGGLPALKRTGQEVRIRARATTRDLLR